jgi:hypothetical protein
MDSFRRNKEKERGTVRKERILIFSKKAQQTGTVEDILRL